MGACKCDACGKLYEEPKSRPDVQVTRYIHPYGDQRFDLCPECQNKLEVLLRVPHK